MFQVLEKSPLCKINELREKRLWKSTFTVEDGYYCITIMAASFREEATENNVAKGTHLRDTRQTIH
jgi:hypothetical protein